MRLGEYQGQLRHHRGTEAQREHREKQEPPLNPEGTEEGKTKNRSTDYTDLSKINCFPKARDFGREGRWREHFGVWDVVGA